MMAAITAEDNPVVLGSALALVAERMVVAMSQPEADE
jgi:hypothetical protein